MESIDKLFGKWEFVGVQVFDQGLQNYINLKPTLVPHSGGKHSAKRFWKAEKASIVERLINKVMRSSAGKKKFAGHFIRGGGGTGKKSMATRAVKEAFEIIEQRTGGNPIQVFVDAIQNAAPREETTTIIYGGVHYHQAVDVAPMRRIDVAIKNLVVSSLGNTFNKKLGLATSLANEIVEAANNDPKSFAIKKKEETERIAQSSR